MNIKIKSMLYCGAFSLYAAQICAQPLPTQGAAPVVEKPLDVDVSGSSNKAIVIAVPAFAAQNTVATKAGSSAELGKQIAAVIAGDLSYSGVFAPKGPMGLPEVSAAQVASPDYSAWSAQGASALLQGFVRADDSGNIVVGCYLYDVLAGSELRRAGFSFVAKGWRRAAHKCADMAFGKMTGEGGFFDSRIIYVAESGSKTHRIKRLAIMDSDGANHQFLTNGQAMVLTPHLTPDQRSIVYMSYQGNRGRIFILDLVGNTQKLVFDTPNLTIAPRVSPDNQWVLFAMSVGGNTNLYRISVNGGEPQQLTKTAGINVGGSYSPDGSKIAFESDRSGSQQIYVMNADGSALHRISFAGGRYATPAWSPNGEWIAFTKIAGSFQIGVFNSDGGNERILTQSWGDEAPNWSPNSRYLAFFRTQEGSGKAQIWSIDLTGANLRRINTPLDGSDPAWGPLLP